MRSLTSVMILALSIGVLPFDLFADETMSEVVLADLQQDRLNKQAEKIRFQYQGSETPDSIMFQSLVRRISDRYAAGPERTIQKVRYEMKFDGDPEAVAFIQILDEQYKTLANSKLQARKSVICNANPKRTQQQLFRDVDMSSDIELTLAAAAYDDFIASLEPEYAAKFSIWLDDAKQGYQYYVFKAESSFNSSADDPVVHYRDKCVQIEQKLGAAG